MVYIFRCFCFDLTIFSRATHGYELHAVCDAAGHGRCDSFRSLIIHCFGEAKSNLKKGFWRENPAQTKSNGNGEHSFSSIQELGGSRGERDRGAGRLVRPRLDT